MQLSPVDPRQLTVDELRVRAWFIARSGQFTPSDEPLSPGWFRCYVCLRSFESDWGTGDAIAEAERRFGHLEPERLIVICSDCNEIISRDVGFPL